MSKNITEKYTNQAKQLKQELADGKISKSEFDELLEDLTNIDKIQKMLNKEGNKIKAAEVVRMISMAAGVL